MDGLLIQAIELGKIRLGWDFVPITSTAWIPRYLAHSFSRENRFECEEVIDALLKHGLAHTNTFELPFPEATVDFAIVRLKAKIKLIETREQLSKIGLRSAGLGEAIGLGLARKEPLLLEGKTNRHPSSDMIHILCECDRLSEYHLAIDETGGNLIKHSRSYRLDDDYFLPFRHMLCVVIDENLWRQRDSIAKSESEKCSEQACCIHEDRCDTRRENERKVIRDNRFAYLRDIVWECPNCGRKGKRPDELEFLDEYGY
jgi:hypothetical protein